MRRMFAQKSIKSLYIAMGISVFLMAFALAYGVGANPGYAQYVAFEDPPQSGENLGGPDLQPTNPITEGGEVAVGGSIQVVNLFRNASNDSLTIEDVNLYPSANVTAGIGTNNCGNAPIPAGAECAISINIQGISPGSYRVEMLVDHTGRSRLTTTAITGQVIGSGEAEDSATGSVSEVEFLPEEINFGEQEESSPLVRSILLNNKTIQPITIEDVSLIAAPKSGFSVSAADCDILQPGQSCLVTTMWTPYAEGKTEGVVVVRHTGPQGTIRVPLMGDYQPDDIDIANAFPERVPGKGLLISDRRDIDFGEEVDGASSITVSLVNAGDSPVTIKSLALAGSNNGLTLAGDGCEEGMMLEGTEACAFTVNWQPRRSGPIIDDVQIVHDGTRGVLVLPIRGEAEEPVREDNSLVAIRSPSGANLNVPPLPGANINYDQIVSTEGSVENDRERRGLGPSRTSSNPTPSLDGYRITSHGPTRAVISGPFGRLIVNDGELEMIAGTQWITRIVPEGVELISDRDVVLLVFDRSFNKPNRDSVTTSNNDDD